MKNYIEILDIKSTIKRFNGVMDYSKTESQTIKGSLIIKFNEKGSTITALNKNKGSLTLITDKSSSNEFADTLIVPISYLDKLNGDYIASYEKDASELIFKPLNRNNKKNDRRPVAKISIIKAEVPENLKTSIPEDYAERYTITDEMATIIDKALKLTDRYGMNTIFNNVSLNTDIASTDSKRILFAKDYGFKSEYTLQLSENMINQIKEGCSNFIVVDYNDRCLYDDNWIYYERTSNSKFPNVRYVMGDHEKDRHEFIKINKEFIETIKESKKYLKNEINKVNIRTKTKSDKIIIEGLDEKNNNYSFDCRCDVFYENMNLPLNIKLFYEMLLLLDNNDVTLNIKLDKTETPKGGVTFIDGDIKYLIMPLRIDK